MRGVINDDGAILVNGEREKLQEMRLVYRMKEANLCVHENGENGYKWERIFEHLCVSRDLHQRVGR